MNNDWGSVFFVTIGKSFNQLGSLILIIVLARVLDVENYSTLRQFIFVGEFTSSIILFAMTDTLLYFTGINPSKKTQYVKSIFIYLLIALLVFILLLLALTKVIGDSFNNDLFSKHFYVFLPYLFYLVFLQYSSSVSVALNKTKSFVIFTFALLIIRILFIFFVFYMESISLSEVLCFYIFVSALLLVYAIFLTPFQNGFLSKKDFVNIFKFNLPLGASIITKKAQNLLDKFFVSFSQSVSRVGIYTNGTLEIPFIDNINSAVNSVYLKSMSTYCIENKYELAIFEWRKIFKVLISIFLPIFLFSFLFSEEVIVFLFSEKYKESAIIFQIFTFRILIKAFPFGMLIIASGFQRKIFHYSLISVFLSLFFAFIGNYFYAEKGIAMGVLVAMFVIFFKQLYDVIAIFETKIFKLFDFKHVFKTIILVSVLGLAAISTQVYFLNLFLSFSFYVVAYLVLGNILNIIDIKEIIKLIKK